MMLQYNRSLDQFTEVIFEEFSSSEEDEEEEELITKPTAGPILILRNGNRKRR